MTKETYPLPGQPLKLVVNNANPEYGENRAQWEERVFRIADHFNVVRFTGGGGSDICTVKTFSEALQLAHNKPRHLIYVVADEGHMAFPMSPKDHAKFAEITLQMRGESLDQKSQA